MLFLSLSKYQHTCVTATTCFISKPGKGYQAAHLEYLTYDVVLFSNYTFVHHTHDTMEAQERRGSTSPRDNHDSGAHD